MLAQSGLSLNDQLPGGDVTIAEALMAPTVIYVKQVILHSLYHILFYFFKIPFFYLQDLSFLLKIGA